MNAIDLIKNKGLPYAANIVNSAPKNAIQWNEGYEFKCGEDATAISPEDKEKYFVDMVELKRIVKNIALIESIGGIKSAKDFIALTGSTMAGILEKAIADYEAVYAGEVKS